MEMFNDWLHKITFYEGQPALMLIIGEENKYTLSHEERGSVIY